MKAVAAAASGSEVKSKTSPPGTPSRLGIGSERPANWRGFSGWPRAAARPGRRTRGRSRWQCPCR
jgi:hypothetical protein